MVKTKVNVKIKDGISLKTNVKHQLNFNAKFKTESRLICMSSDVEEVNLWFASTLLPPMN